MAAKATILYWKLEDVPVGDGEAPHSEDIGPAWIYLPDGSEEEVLGGEWITRTDAERLAGENGYHVQLDERFRLGRSGQKAASTNGLSAVRGRGAADFKVRHTAKVV